MILRKCPPKVAFVLIYLFVILLAIKLLFLSTTMEANLAKAKTHDSTIFDVSTMNFFQIGDLPLVGAGDDWTVPGHVTSTTRTVPKVVNSSIVRNQCHWRDRGASVDFTVRNLCSRNCYIQDRLRFWHTIFFPTLSSGEIFSQKAAG